MIAMGTFNGCLISVALNFDDVVEGFVWTRLQKFYASLEARGTFSQNQIITFQWEMGRIEQTLFANC